VVTGFTPMNIILWSLCPGKYNLHNLFIAVFYFMSKDRLTQSVQKSGITHDLFSVCVCVCPLYLEHVSTL
jgi:hypothetical protein